MSTVRTDVTRWWRRSARYRPRLATDWIVAITVLAYVVQLATRGVLEQAFAYAPEPAFNVLEPWRLLTTALIHQPVGPGLGIVGIAHIGFNMYALMLFGRPLENVLGSRKLVAIYVLSVLAGSVAVLYASFVGLIDPRTEVYGASGGVFGVLGAVLAVQRRLGVDVRSLLIMIGINFAIPFLVRTIAWQAHLGGLIVGVVLGWVLISNRGPRRSARGWAITGGIAVLLVALALAPALVPA